MTDMKTRNLPAVSLEDLSLRIDHRPLVNEPTRDWSYGNRIFTDYDLFVGYKGVARFTIEKQTYELLPGCALLVPPQKTFSIDASDKPGPSSIAQHFTLNVFAEIDFFSLVEYETLVNLGTSHEILPLYRRYVQLYDSPRFQITGKALFLYILFSFLETAYLSDRMELSKHHIVIQLLGCLEAHALDTDVQQRLAEVSPYSEGYTVQLFKSFVGKTPKQYVRDKCMTHARDLLIEGYSVKETATLCRFEDEFYFSRAFKRCVGVSPRAFRKHVLSDST